MHRTRIWILLLFVVYSLFSQGQSFYELGKKQIPVVDSLYQFHTAKATEQTFDYFSDSTLQIELNFNLLLSKFNKNRTDTLMQSVALVNLARFCSTHANSMFRSNFTNKESKTKRIKQILYHCKTSYGLISLHTFSVPLLKEKRHYFYDKNGTEGGFNIYLGQKPSAKEIENDFEYIPLEMYTYLEINEHLVKKIRTSSISREVSRRRTNAVGYHFFLNEKTIGKRRIPELRCIIILGHKRMPKQKIVNP